MATDGIITDSWQGPDVRAQSSPAGHSVQCPHCAHARCTLRAPVHAAHYARAVYSRQAPAALGASVNSRVIRSEPEIDVAPVKIPDNQTMISFHSGSYFELNQI